MNHHLARILVVSDEPLIRHLVARFLDHAGYAVVLAEDGEAGFRELSQAQPPIALILINTYLPDLTGSEAVARVRQFFPDAQVLHLDELSPGPFDAGRLLDAVRDVPGLDRRGGIRRGA